MKTNRLFIAILSIVFCVNFSACKDDNSNSEEVYEIHVEKAGTLKQLMPAPNYATWHYLPFKCLRLTGEINQQDIDDAQNLLGAAETIDMGGVTVVEGEIYNGTWNTTPANKIDMLNTVHGAARIVILPHNLEEYENGGGAYLTSIKLPETLKKFGEDALSGSALLETIEIPQGVYYIGKSAFSDCKKLSKIALSDNVTEIKDQAFYGCESLSAFDIPSKVTKIESETFKNCVKLSTITQAITVTSIGNSAFSGCKNLEIITIPQNVTTIGSYTFSGCEKLKEVHVKNPVPPVADKGLFGINEYVGDNIDLYVPKGSKKLYQKAKYWQEVRSIIEE